MGSIRIVLADDHRVVRRGIREFLEEGHITVIAEAENGNQAIEAIDKHLPDVAILDIQMPAPNGLEVARHIRQKHGNTIAILILTAYDDPPYLRAALTAGANGYILKSADADDFLAAVQDAYEGKTIIAASLLNKSALTNVGPIPNALTDREIEILQLAAKGMTNKAIGFTLSISDRTVQGHLAHIYSKLYVTGRTEATLKAIQMELIKT